MTIIQWEGVTNISNALHLESISFFIDFISKKFNLISACNLDAPICLQSAEDIFDQYDFDADNFDIDFYALFLLYILFNVFAFVILWLRVRKN